MSRITRPTTDMVRFANSILSGWGDAYYESMHPEDGSIVKRTRTITEEFRVKYENDGTVKYIPIKQDGGKYEASETET